MGATISFYHYTNDLGKDAIVREKLIRQSNGATDALYGPGVYGTSLPPSVGRTRIVLNNWDGAVNVNTGVYGTTWNNYDGNVTPGTLLKASWAIKVDLLPTMVTKAQTDRDILIYTAGDLPLGFFQVIKVD